MIFKKSINIVTGVILFALLLILSFKGFWLIFKQGNSNDLEYKTETYGEIFSISVVETIEEGREYLFSRISHKYSCGSNICIG